MHAVAQLALLPFVLQERQGNGLFSLVELAAAAGIRAYEDMAGLGQAAAQEVSMALAATSNAGSAEQSTTSAVLTTTPGAPADGDRPRVVYIRGQAARKAAEAVAKQAGSQ
jgi:hypothetical protein